MKPLVLIILASVWAAVLIPPLLRNRLENRPNSSVTDFRRQLNKLQSTVPSRNGAHVSMARPLAASPLQRPAAPGRPGRPASGRRQHAEGEQQLRPLDGRGRPQARRDQVAVRDSQSNRRHGRAHGDPSGQTRRPSGEFRRATPGQTPPRGRRRPETAGRQRPNAGHRQTQVQRDPHAGDVARRRRLNILFLLMGATVVTLFLATQSRSTAMLSVFALSFIALCGYLYMLSQARTREANQWGRDWMS